MKKVSIIIPTYRGSKYVLSAVNSALNQTYKNIEVIVVDDNGINSDEQLETFNKLEEYIITKKVKYVVHEKNLNGSAARNTGVKNSNGDLLCFLDDDDLYKANKVQDSVEKFNELDNSFGMVYCSVEIKSEKESYVRKAKKSGDLLFDLLMHNVVIGSGSLCVKRSVFEKVNGFDTTFKRHQDYEFTARVADKYKISPIENVGYVYHRSINRNTPKTIKQAKEYRIHYLKKMDYLIDKFPQNKKRTIVSSNLIEVYSYYLRNGNLTRFYKEIKNKSANLGNEVKFITLLHILVHRIKRKSKKILE